MMMVRAAAAAVYARDVELQALANSLTQQHEELRYTTPSLDTGHTGDVLMAVCCLCVYVCAGLWVQCVEGVLG